MAKMIDFVFNGETIATDRLYRYNLKDDGEIEILEKIIVHSYGDRLVFSDRQAIGKSRVGKVTSGQIVYIPIKDDEEAIRLLRNYCYQEIEKFERKIDHYRRCIDLMR